MNVRAQVKSAGPVRWLAALLTLLAAVLFAAPAMAANCYYANGQGATGPAAWQTYCWLDLTSYNDATARTGAGQNFSYTLPDGTVMTFNMKVTGATLTGAASPSWSGAAVGNTAFTGIGGRPILYQTAAGTSTVTITAITLTPPSSGSITNYMFVAADGESSNQGETLSFQTDGGGWQLLDQAGPTTGSTYPTASGLGTGTYSITGAVGTVGAFIVGSTTPRQVVTTLVGGGLQGAMFAVRFASIRLNTQITGARVNAADQFTFSINSTSSGTALSSGTSSGTGLGPFTAAALSSSASIPLTLNQTMASGSSSALSEYRSLLSCTNAASTGTPLPTNVQTTSYNFGALQFGDAVQCTFTETPYPHLMLTKVLGGTNGRRFASDQFVMNIDQGSTTVATTTTTGTGTTISNGSTPLTQVTAGSSYKLYELGAGVTALNQYTSTMACTNAATSGTALPTAPGGTITPQMGDVVTCTITNTRRATNATLTITKASVPISDPVNGTTNPKAIPGAIIRYTFVVQNSGPTAVDNNTVLLIDSLPIQISVGTSATPTFTQGSPTSALTFTAANDIRYSNATTAPTAFSGCTYTPTSAYDPAVKFVCINPKGSFAGSSGTPPSFTLSIQAQVK